MEPEKFKIVFAITLILSLIIMASIIFFYKKKGKNIEDNKFQLKIGALFLSIVVAVFWFANISLKTKLIITLVSFGVGLFTFLFIDRVGRKIRKVLGVETKGDKIKKMNK
jgi:O-antigen/teichoic acid export membrane protein